MVEKKTSKTPWENWVGRIFVGLILGLVGGSFLIAIFVSLHQAVNKPPKAWVSSLQAKKKRGYFMKSTSLQKCILKLKKLDEELETEATSLWFRIRKGKRDHLTAWKDWGKDWRRRMHLLKKDCPFQNELQKGVTVPQIQQSSRVVIPTAFFRASQRLMTLQKRQEQALHLFYKENLWLFKEIRQGLQNLKEETR